GMQFQEALRGIAPAVAERMVFVTGGAQTPEAAAFLELTTCTCLAKPFNGEALREAVTAAARR
ncbi:MAG TPA: hypothetical protein VF341_13990, partial [Anaeromyxobacteraceae bacterium]